MVVDGGETPVCLADRSKGSVFWFLRFPVWSFGGRSGGWHEESYLINVYPLSLTVLSPAPTSPQGSSPGFNLPIQRCSPLPPRHPPAPRAPFRVCGLSWGAAAVGGCSWPSLLPLLFRLPYAGERFGRSPVPFVRGLFILCEFVFAEALEFCLINPNIAWRCGPLFLGRELAAAFSQVFGCCRWALRLSQRSGRGIPSLGASHFSCTLPWHVGIEK